MILFVDFTRISGVMTHVSSLYDALFFSLFLSLCDIYCMLNLASLWLALSRSLSLVYYIYIYTHTYICVNI